MTIIKEMSVENLKNSYFYNPRNVELTDQEKKEIFRKTNNFKTPKLTIHLTGDTTKLKEIIDFNDIVINLPKKVEKTADDVFKEFKMGGCPNYSYNIKEIPFIVINFISDEDKIELGKQLGKKLTRQTKFIHYPNEFKSGKEKLKYTYKHPNNPKYPVYIISKGRWEKRKTQKLMEKCEIPYKIVVEPAEYDKYEEVIDKKNILVCPENYSEKKQGSIPVRNFVWQHAVESGAHCHWILDDNISDFYRYNNNLRVKVFNGVALRAHEDYVDKFNYVLLSGLQYKKFVPDRCIRKPFTYNTRIFSCILINHELDSILDERWRGKYNEDVDLSIRVLKAGVGTILNNQFLCEKETTLTSSGGNTDTIYGGKKDNTEFLLAKAQSLKDQHPDLVKIINRYKRGVHHYANLMRFINNDLGYDETKETHKSNFEYGLELVEIE